MATPKINGKIEKGNNVMSEERKQVSLEEIAVSNMVSIEAMVRMQTRVQR